MPAHSYAAKCASRSPHAHCSLTIVLCHAKCVGAVSVGTVKQCSRHILHSLGNRSEGVVASCKNSQLATSCTSHFTAFAVFFSQNTVLQTIQRFSCNVQPSSQRSGTKLQNQRLESFVEFVVSPLRLTTQSPLPWQIRRARPFLATASLALFTTNH